MSGAPEAAPPPEPPQTLAGIGAAASAIPLARPGGGRLSIALACAAALLGPLAGLAARPAGSAGLGVLDAAARDWWIGVASGSLLLSATLLLLEAEWRGGINRVAETVALLAALAAALCATLGPGPPPDALGLAALLAACASLWALGLLPDLAVLRDRAAATAGPGWFRAAAYRRLAAGWRGSAAHWQVWGQASRAVALLGILLAVAVETGVALRLAGTPQPGRHGTLMPVSLLVSAVQSGVGVTAAVLVAVRALGPGALVTPRHLDVLARLLLCLGCAAAYRYGADAFATLLDGGAAARAALARRLAGPHAPAFWAGGLCLVLPAQVFWSARARAAPRAVAAVGLLTALGAGADRVAVLVAGSADGPLPGIFDARGLAGSAASLGLFLALLALALRHLPAVSITECRRLALARAPVAPVAGRAAGGAALRPVAAPVGARLWGLSARFSGQGDLAAALQALSGVAARDVRLDGHGPVPMPRTIRALGLEGRSIAPYALAGALAGGAGFLGACAFAGAGDALAPGAGLAWPALVVPGASCALLGGCLAVDLAFLALNRLPRPGHPALGIPGFRDASDDGFLLTAEARGAGFEPAAIERRLAGLPIGAGRPLEIRRIPL